MSEFKVTPEQEAARVALNELLKTTQDLTGVTNLALVKQALLNQLVKRLEDQYELTTLDKSPKDLVGIIALLEAVTVEVTEKMNLQALKGKYEAPVEAPKPLEVLTPEVDCGANEGCH